MKKTTTTLIAAAALVAAPGVAAADYGIDSPEYRDGRICYIPLDAGTTWGYVLDTFTIVDANPWDVPNAGSTSGPGPLTCLPTACPDGYHMVSTSCMSTDPFAQIPFDPAPSQGLNESAASTRLADALPTRVSATVDVGPLVEPGIAAVTS